MSEKELLGEVKRHIDYTNAMGEKSLRDLQIENLYNLLQQKENIIKEVREYIEEYYESNEDMSFEEQNKLLKILEEENNENSNIR